MARQNTPLDDRVDSAMIRVAEDLTLDIEEIAREIVKEFEGSPLPASYEAIAKELREARAVQIEENRIYDRLFVEGVD